MQTQPMCNECGTPLPKDAPGGLCPRCLVKVASPSQSGPSAPGEDRGRDDSHTLSLEQIGAQFPQLEVLESLGRGGMGMVFKARQPELDRIVALKILLPATAQDPAFADRFAREAKLLAKLNHPNIVTIHDSGRTEAGLYYFVMEFADGPDLHRIIHSRELLPPQALALVPEICDALQYAHDQGVVHRDIKPENILLDRGGRVKIADFGLAKLLGHAPDDAKLTGSHQLMGTPRYMAPEQFQTPQDVDHRADIYSLGVVFYEMLTGEPPMGRFLPPSQKVQVDVRLDGVVLKALEREPERRYQHASEVRVDVDTITREAEVRPGTPGGRGAAPPSCVGTGRTKGRKSPLRRLAVGGIAAALLCFFAFLVSLFVPAVHQARHGVRVAREKADMRAVASALQEYASEHNGRFPDDLGLLFDAGYLADGNAFVCRRSGMLPPTSGEDIRNGQSDLLYFGGGKDRTTCGPDDPVVVTKPGVLGRLSVVVVYGDGSVKSHTTPPARVQELVPRANASSFP